VVSGSLWIALRATFISVCAADVQLCPLLLRLQFACCLWPVGCSVTAGFWRWWVFISPEGLRQGCACVS